MLICNVRPTTVIRQSIKINYTSQSIAGEDLSFKGFSCFCREHFIRFFVIFFLFEIITLQMLDDSISIKKEEKKKQKQKQTIIIIK